MMIETKKINSGLRWLTNIRKSVFGEGEGCEKKHKILFLELSTISFFNLLLVNLSEIQNGNVCVKIINFSGFSCKMFFFYNGLFLHSTTSLTEDLDFPTFLRIHSFTLMKQPHTHTHTQSSRER